MNEKTGDNSRLEEMLNTEIDCRDEFLNTLKDSRLFLPVIFRKKRQECPNQGQFGFDINYLPGGDGYDSVFLFTSLQLLEKNMPVSSSIEISMRDLAEILRQTAECTTVSIIMKNSFSMSIDEFLGLFGIVSDHKIKDIRNDKLKELINANFSDDDIIEELVASSVIVPCCDDEYGLTSFFITDDREGKLYFAICTDLDEFDKVFGSEDELYPQAYHFRQLLNADTDYFVINPASESLLLDSGMFKSQISNLIHNL